jgi:predicted GIY-YIG superfamily endonuclease
LDSRVEWHRKGLAANHTSLRLPIELVYSEQFGSLVHARKRERQLKRWSGQKKMALVAKGLITR